MFENRNQTAYSIGDHTFEAFLEGYSYLHTYVHAQLEMGLPPETIFGTNDS